MYPPEASVELPRSARVAMQELLEWAIDDAAGCPEYQTLCGALTGADGGLASDLLGWVTKLAGGVANEAAGSGMGLADMGQELTQAIREAAEAHLGPAVGAVLGRMAASQPERLARILAGISDAVARLAGQDAQSGLEDGPFVPPRVDPATGEQRDHYLITVLISGTVGLVAGALLASAMTVAAYALLLTALELVAFIVTINIGEAVVFATVFAVVQAWVVGVLTVTLGLAPGVAGVLGWILAALVGSLAVVAFVLVVALLAALAVFLFSTAVLTFVVGIGLGVEAFFVIGRWTASVVGAVADAVVGFFSGLIAAVADWLTGGSLTPWSEARGSGWWFGSGPGSFDISGLDSSLLW